MSERIDLHTHSDCSDGRLSPAALVAAASARLLVRLALTDHDTTRGLPAAAAACQRTGIGFIAGIELTTAWRGREIHVVGLGIDPEAHALQAYAADVRGRRRARARLILERLGRQRITLPGLRPVLEDAEAVLTRAHIARALVECGAVPDFEAAFERHLGAGGSAHVAGDWPALDECVRGVRAAGGVAVLAHPHRYRFSAGGLRELCGAFAAAGGAGIEVSLAGMGPGDASRACALARRFALAGSVGSDFHEPGLPWRPLGRFDKLPDGVAPLAERLGPDGALRNS